MCTLFFYLPVCIYVHVTYTHTTHTHTYIHIHTCTNSKCNEALYQLKRSKQVYSTPVSDSYNDSFNDSGSVLIRKLEKLWHFTMMQGTPVANGHTHIYTFILPLSSSQAQGAVNGSGIA